MNILILGFGKTGRALYSFLKKKNFNISVYDQKDVSNEVDNYYNYQRLKKELPLFDLAIRSPGISLLSKEYQLVYLLSKELISELDFSFRYIKTKKIIGVTGSNGKTTTCKMLEHILKTKYRVFLAGNIDVPLISIVDEVGKNDILIVEVSSFMLEDTRKFVFENIVITSLSPNHLDQVGHIENYYASKKRVIMNLENINHLYCQKEVADKLNIYKKDYQEQDYHLINSLTYNQNLNKVIEVSRYYGIELNEIRKIIKSYKFEKYRQEIIYNDKQLMIINDSKSTSSESTNFALEEYKIYPINLILSGNFKGENISEIKLKLAKKVYSYGAISKLLPDFVIKKNNLEEILVEIKKDFKKGVVIFSPGGSSFDLYNSYKQRGEHFEMMVKKLWK